MPASDNGAYRKFAAAAASERIGDILRQLEQLAASPPLWPIELDRWAGIVAAVVSFAQRWDEPARAHGWSELQLYGLHARTPGANLAAMGAAWCVACSRHCVIVRGVQTDAIDLETRTGSPLRIYRRSPDPAAVLA